MVTGSALLRLQPLFISSSPVFLVEAHIILWPFCGYVGFTTDKLEPQPHWTCCGSRRWCPWLGYRSGHEAGRFKEAQIPQNCCPRIPPLSGTGLRCCFAWLCGYLALEFLLQYLLPFNIQVLFSEEKLLVCEELNERLVLTKGPTLVQLKHASTFFIWEIWCAPGIETFLSLFLHEVQHWARWKPYWNQTWSIWFKVKTFYQVQQPLLSVTEIPLYVEIHSL